jgi:transaldolase
MSDSIKSLIHSGTKLWLDSIDPELVQENFEMGATGATSNPAIIADLLKGGKYDDRIEQMFSEFENNEDLAWRLNDEMVSEAEKVFQSIWESSAGNDGYVSFELDPLLEDADVNLDHAARVKAYVSLGQKWSAGHTNRMIKVPATPAGIEALEPLAAAGVPLNVTLIFTRRQYEAARDAVWRGAQKLKSLEKFKSVYSIFVSRIDVYTAKRIPDLSEALAGQVGTINAKLIWADNQQFWADKKCPLNQEIVFASTGTKNPDETPYRYVAALAGSDIQTNPPKTNEAAAESGHTFDRQVDQLPADEILNELTEKVDMVAMEKVLMEEGVAKFVKPQRQLIELISEQRGARAI